MDPPDHSQDLTTIARIILAGIIGIIAIPLAAGLLWHCPLHAIFGFVGSILVFQPVAAGLGIAIGIPPVPVIVIMFAVGISVIVIFFGICDLFAGNSAWLRDHLDSVNAIAGRSSLFKKYGIITLIPFIWVPGVGLYGCILLAWLFRWRDARGIAIILAGWMLASLLVVGATLGVMGFIT